MKTTAQALALALAYSSAFCLCVKLDAVVEGVREKES